MLPEAMHRSRNGFKETLNTTILAGLSQNTAPAVSCPFAIQAPTAETPMAALALGNEVSQPDFFSRGAAESAEVGGLDSLRELRVSA